MIDDSEFNIDYTTEGHILEVQSVLLNDKTHVHREFLDSLKKNLDYHRKKQKEFEAEGHPNPASIMKSEADSRQTSRPAVTWMRAVRP